MASKMDMSFTSSHACQSAIRSAQITQSSGTFNSTIAFTSIVYFRMDSIKVILPVQQANKPHVAKAAKLKICLKCLNSQTSTAGLTYCSFHPSWHCVKHEQVLLG
ncbi:hypothetical protein AMTRI_Chr07g74480 [Amborella trichopoda]